MTFDSDIRTAQQKLHDRQFKLALRAAKSAMRKNPRSPFPLNIAGIALGGMGNHRAAVIQFNKALKMDPQFTDARKNLAQSLILSNQLTLALRVLERLIVLTPQEPDAWYLLAQAKLKLGLPQEAVSTVSKSIELAPGMTRAFKLRATAFGALDQHEAALEDLRKISVLAPHDPSPQLEASVMLIRMFRTDEAREILEKMLLESPENPQAHNIYAMLMAMLGDRQKAAIHYRKTIDLDANHGEAFLQLSSLQDQPENGEMIARLDNAIKAAARKSHTRALMFFARAAIRKQSGDSVAEASDLNEANRIEAALRPYDRHSANTVHSALTAWVPSLPAASVSLPDPIFILGLPRSGTTLLEQVLSASEQVFGCGELPMGASLNDLAATGGLDKFSAPEFAETYRDSLPEMPTGTTHFVDKLPGNYKVIGLLCSAFPNARFLHLARDPRDVALSMWRGYFAQSGLNFTFDQAAMAHEINQYRRYMQHWAQQYSEVVLTLRYEDLVSDVENTGRRVAEFCDIEWTPSMAKPELNQNAVRTASAFQVRDGVHQRSVDGWQSMATALAAFATALDADLWPELEKLN